MARSREEIFKLLNAPFREEQVKIKPGRTQFGYVTGPDVMNRLDEVMGPDGWRDSYVQTDGGVVCTLELRLPGANSLSCEWVAKSDAGGFPNMQNSGDGAEENSIKGGYTDAFKRAAVKWGIARHLCYENKGGAAPASKPALYQPNDGGEVAKPSPRPAQAQPQRQYDNFKIPSIGRGLYPWAKGLEEHFGRVGIIKLLDQIGGFLYLPRSYKDWEPAQVEDAGLRLIEELKTWDCYKGEFDHIAPRAEDNPDFGPAPSKAEVDAVPF